MEITVKQDENKTFIGKTLNSNDIKLLYLKIQHGQQHVRTIEKLF